MRRIQAGSLGEDQLRWLLRRPGVNGVVRPAVRAALQRQVQARFKQTRSKFSWPELLQKAYRVPHLLDFDTAVELKLEPVTLWVAPIHLPWLAWQREGFTTAVVKAEIVVYRDRPLVCLCVPAGSEAVTSLLVKKRPKPKRESDESLRARARKAAEAVFHHGAQDMDETEIVAPEPSWALVARE